jgi:Cu+-exporting ATPase
VAAAVEQGSEHPIAAAVVAGAESPPGEVTEFAAMPGLGARGTVEGRTVFVGRTRLLRDAALVVSHELDTERAALEATGATVVLVGWSGVARGLLVLRDEVRPTSADAVARLRALGLRPVLLTGDNARTAAAVGAAVGITDVRAELLPADKLTAVRQLQACGAVVAFVGDGVNDAAALAGADLGMAVGHGTDAAIEAADIVLGRDDLLVVADAVELARRTHRTIRGNLVWAFAYNVAALPLAVAGLLSPLVAGAAMALSSVFVVTHSLALQRFHPPRGAR